MLNDNLEFAQLPASEQAAFRGPGVKTQLPAGTRIFRFSVSDYNSPWWSEVKDLAGILSDAKRSNETFATYIRKRTAVFKHWNIQNNLVIAELTQPVFAFKGIIAPQMLGRRDLNKNGQPVFGKKYSKPIFWGGGFSQVFLKGIDTTHYKVVLPAGAILITDPIDDIAATLYQYGFI